jgi:hypothetical protein
MIGPRLLKAVCQQFDGWSSITAYDEKACDSATESADDP